MKKISLIVSIAFVLAACGGNESAKTDPTEEKKSEASIMDNPDYDKGLNLVAKSDCFTCHKLREASTGPSYGDVAKKYENTDANVDMLADKIIKGGQGVWGQIPMAAHPQVSKEDAKQMVKYILLLKEETK